MRGHWRGISAARGIRPVEDRHDCFGPTPRLGGAHRFPESLRRRALAAARPRPDLSTGCAAEPAAVTHGLGESARAVLPATARGAAGELAGLAAVRCRL